MVVDSQIESPQSAEVEGLDSGVIEEARRRQRRHRIVVTCVVALVAAAVAGIVAFGTGGVGRHPAPPARPTAPTWLTGPPLGGPTHLRLVVSENIGPPSIVSVDSGRVQAVGGLGVPRRQRLWSPALYPLTVAPGGALAVVTRQDCAHCTVTRTEFFIGTDGSVRRTAKLTLARDQHTSASVLGSTSASWVLTWPRSGRCTLQREPGAASAVAVAVPCGSIESDTPAGLVISRGSTVMLVDAHTGRVRQRFRGAAQFDVVGNGFALVGTGIAASDTGPTSLTLVNLASGARRPLRWPSTLRFGYQAFPEPHGPLVAVEFGDPSYAGGQAGDVWVLDTRTGGLTHVPGFPILEYLKFSGITWTSDHRLVVAAQGGGRTTLGVWRPGSARLQVGTVPPLQGYSQLVQLSR